MSVGSFVCCGCGYEPLDEEVAEYLHCEDCGGTGPLNCATPRPRTDLLNPGTAAEFLIVEGHESMECECGTVGAQHVWCAACTSAAKTAP